MSDGSCIGRDNEDMEGVTGMTPRSLDGLVQGGVAGCGLMMGRGAAGNSAPRSALTGGCRSGSAVDAKPQPQAGLGSN